MNKIRDLKKECRDKLKLFEKQEEQVIIKCNRRFTKLGMMGKMALAKANRVAPRTDEIPELSMLCQAVVDN